MNIFFDHNISPRMAIALDGFLDRQGSAIALRDMFYSGIKDVDWITRLQEDPKDWIVFSGDLRITRNQAEKAAWLGTNLKGFFLAKGFRSLIIEHQMGRIFSLLPEIRKEAARAGNKGCMLQLPVTGKKLKKL